MKAINLPHFKNRLRDLSRELFLDHGWELPNGLQQHGGRSPFNFTLAEWQQAKRLGLDPREIKQVFREAWELSDSLTGLRNALEDRGYVLAKGDRRGVVALDVEGNVYAFARFAGLKTKDLRERLGNTPELPSVSETRADIRSRLRGQAQGYLSEVRAKHQAAFEPLNDERQQMVAQHRKERAALNAGQSDRWAEEQRDRMARLNGGMRGLLDRLTGKAQSVRQENEQEALACARRDQKQRDDLALAQMEDRQALQKRIDQLRKSQAEERRVLARSIATALKRQSRDRAPEPPGRSRRTGPTRDR